jgi:hypothetical protein
MYLLQTTHPSPTWPKLFRPSLPPPCTRRSEPTGDTRLRRPRPADEDEAMTHVAHLLWQKSEQTSGASDGVPGANCKLRANRQYWGLSQANKNYPRSR